MSAWESFWRSVRRNGRVIEMSPSDPVPPVSPADTKLSAELAETRWKLFDARARISELETERDAAVRDRQYALEDRDKAIRQRDAHATESNRLAAESFELAGRLNEERQAFRGLAEKHRQCAVDQDKHKRRADDLSKECAELRMALEVARCAPSPDQDHRNCLDLSDRNAELRAENERLELEVARLQGRSTEQDWTGGFQPVTTS